MTLFPTRWPALHPDRLQVYSLVTPNGKKVGVALEEMGLSYEAHRVSIGDGEQFDPEFIAISPNSKIPAIIDPDGPDGQPVAIFESGAILLYLARKSGKFGGDTELQQLQIQQWLFLQVAGVGPMFGQLGHFYKFAHGKTDTYGQERYRAEVERLLRVLDARLSDREYLVDQYSIADMATMPWVTGLDFYGVREFLGLDRFTNVTAWVDRVTRRPAYQRGIQVCA